MEDKQRVKHESFGNIQISRVSGTKRSLFGSDLVHNNTITLSISLADLTRDINCDWYHPYKQLIEIEMSPTQFAEAITNMNSDGVPCTIRQFDGEHMEECPYRDKTEIFRNEFKSTVNSASAIARSLVREVSSKFKEKKALTKADKEEILSLLETLNANIDRNLGYISDCCQEQVEKTVLEAKGEVESYITHRITTLGTKALQEELRAPVELVENKLDK